MKQCFALALLLSFTRIHAQEFKVVGYLAAWNLNDCALQTDWDKLTHINIAFANPDADGNLHVYNTDIDAIVWLAHQHHVKVFISLAGGYLEPDWETAWNYWMQPDNRSAYIQKIVQFTLAHNLDGVDIDLEWQYVTDLYSPFVLELKNSLQLAGLSMTAALPGGYRYPQISSEALAAFDWVNLMIYDLTGPWAPQNPGQHSPIDWAQQCLQYWNEQGLPGNKQTLGVQFYGYDFASTPVQGLDYQEIVAMDTAYAQLDQVGQLFYNGIPTIIAKTQMALQQTSGVMIWELGGDACGDLSEFSLLSAIDLTIQTSGDIQPAMEMPLYLYPNPVLDELTIGQQENLQGLVRITDLQGRLQWEGRVSAGQKIDVHTLSTGIYLLHFQTDTQNRVKRFVKM